MLTQNQQSFIIQFAMTAVLVVCLTGVVVIGVVSITKDAREQTVSQSKELPHEFITLSGMTCVRTLNSSNLSCDWSTYKAE